MLKGADTMLWLGNPFVSLFAAWAIWTGCLTAIAPSALAADRVLVISSWAAPGHSINSRFWPAFIKALEEASGGRVSARIVYDLAPPSGQLDLIESGQADIGWIFHGYHPERFPSARLLEMPGHEAGAEALSVAYWRAYEAYFKAGREYDSVKLIGLMVQGAGQLHSVRKIARLDEIAGLRLRLTGAVSHDMSKALGAKGVYIPASRIGKALEAKTVDGILLALDSRRDFSFNSALPYVFEIPGGFYRSSFALAMNEKAFATLPSEIKTLLDEKVFGEKLSRLAGAVWDQSDAIGRAATRASEGASIGQASAEDLPRFRAIIARERERIIEDVARTGIPARTAVDFIAAEIGSPGKAD